MLLSSFSELGPTADSNRATCQSSAALHILISRFVFESLITDAELLSGGQICLIKRISCYMSNSGTTCSSFRSRLCRVHLIADEVIHSTRMPRRLHAAVRIQLVETNF